MPSISTNLYLAENLSLGSKQITPFWRILKKNGELNERYPDGIDAQKAMLEAKGHKVILKEKKYFVEDYQKKIFSL